MAHLDEDILAFHAAFGPCAEIRTVVVVQQVLRDARALRLPVAPDAHRAVMDMVAADLDDVMDSYPIKRDGTEEKTKIADKLLDGYAQYFKWNDFLFRY